MFTPEEQQVEICLLKSSLAEIENEMVVQRDTLPTLDAENEQQYRETMSALQVARTLNAEIERLKQDNVRLIARRMQLKRQCEVMSRGLAEARETRDRHMADLKLHEDEDEQNIRQYEDNLREKAERFRKARVFYNETEMSKEIANMESVNEALKDEALSKQSLVESLQVELDSITARVPDDILNILGKQDMEDYSKSIITKCQELEENLKKYS